jgi:hypothetical protein
MQLIEALREKQGSTTQEEFAAHLGISKSLLVQVYGHSKAISKALARRIVQLYPELEQQVCDYLLGKEPTRPHTRDRQPDRAEQ